jgi:septum formation protein
VLTAVTVVRSNGLRETRVVRSVCRMKPLSSEEIERYVLTDAWRGKAGGYGIQDDGGDVFHGDPFVERVEGSYTNIVGLPMEATIEMLADAGIHPAPAKDRRVKPR